MNPMNRFCLRWFAAVVACAALSSAVMLVGAQELTQPATPSAAPKPSVSRVVVRTLVDSTGTVKATQIRESSGNSRLDEEALQVVSKVWSFSPLKINGKGIEVWVNVPINFVQAEAPVVPAPPPEVVPVVPVTPVVTEPVPSGVPPAKPASEAAAVQAQPAASDAAQTPASAPLLPASPPSLAPVTAPEPAASSAEGPAASATTPTPAAPAASAAN